MSELKLRPHQDARLKPGLYINKKQDGDVKSPLQERRAANLKIRHYKGRGLGRGEFEEREGVGRKGEGERAAR